ncbi:MAG: hypothetical protein WD872_07615 [Pirellulaceae bacterium]
MLVLVTTVTAVTSGTGCATLERWSSAVIVRAQQSHQFADIRTETRQELSQQLMEERRLAAEREVEQARIAAERMRLETEFCAANQEQLREQLKSNIREEVESKVAFNVRQGLEVGELEVDEEELRELLKERDQPPPVPPRAPVTEKCKSCDAPCGCEPGLLRRHCHRCRHKPCEAEKTCGGPETLALLEKQPFRQPLRPTEIPLKLPVRLSFGMQQPVLESARIRRQPIVDQPRDQFREGPCPKPCTDPANPYGQGLPSTGSLQPAAPIQAPPQPLPPVDYPQKPEVDPSGEARGRSPFSAHGFKLGMRAFGRLQ